MMHCTKKRFLEQFVPKVSTGKTALLVGSLICVLQSSPILSKEPKLVRFSGKLISWEPEKPEPFFVYQDSTSLREKKIFCDYNTMKLVPYKEGQNSSIEGKMSQVNPTSEIWICHGKPHIFSRYEVGVTRPDTGVSKQVQGQVVEANPSTGQIVYLVKGRRNYLTIDPIEAKEMADRLEKLELVEISGSYRYDRIRRIYLKN